MSAEVLLGILPLISSLVTFVFAYFVFKRWGQRRRLHLLFWGIGLIFYGIGGAMEAYYGLVGWHPWVFRLWYLFGAVLVAAWLGQGTAFLLLKRRVAWVLLVILSLGSLYAVFKVFTAELDPTLMLGSELSGHAIVTPGVRVLTPFFNIYGVVLLVGGAIYSAWLFWRKRVLLNRVVGNILIAAGAMSPAFGGAFQRAGIPYTLYIGELLGAVLMFIGFLYATQMVEPARQVGVSTTASGSAR
ncbi:MAG: hypothetical protein D6775_08935 [Caldilineae bacterium]|nr:MAG: hypothetical protein D6775_08935 [Caldilineae bacterium]